MKIANFILHYRVVFDKTTLPNDYRFTEQDQGTDDTKDSDINATGSTPIFTLTQTDLNLDAGARSNSAVAGEIIKSEEDCDCEPYEESVVEEAKDSVPVHSLVWLFILFGTSIVSGFFFRKEESLS
ncbi:MAG: hypothetical protein IE889_01190 [Campylobacterales bacterium]|nr:hypothetical protein [Campylobacterales bacterium]